MDELKIPNENKSSKPEPRKHHSAAAVGKNLVVIGGVTDEAKCLGDIWRLDLSTHG